MNEPQLSAEIEKLFDEEFGYLSVAIDYYVENAYPLRKESGMKHLRDIKHFLATALEEQRKAINDEWLYQKANDHDARIRADERAKVLSEVLEIVEETMKISYSGSDHVDNIKAKLNQLKGITI